MTSGSIKGLRAQGGFEVDVAWKGGKLAGVRVKENNGAQKLVMVRYGDLTKKVEIKSDGEVSLSPDLQPKKK